MNDSKTTAKLIDQLKRFLGRISPQFRRPTIRFVGDMLYGILAEKDVKLANIARALSRPCSMKKKEDRLSRLLSTERLADMLHRAIAREGARRVRGDTLIIVDPSDIQKTYARRMEHLAKVWDGSRGVVGDDLGYWGCMAVACESGGRRPVPLHFRVWSAEASGHVSENVEVESVLDTLTEHTRGRGIYVYDRGGDNIEFYRYFACRGLDFIVRLKERHVRSWRKTYMCGELAWQCTMRYRDVAEGYMTRWRVEETIRHVKQSYSLEDVRLMKYDKLRNLAAIVLAEVYFSMAWIGNSEKHEVIARSILRSSAEEFRVENEEPLPK